MTIVTANVGNTESTDGAQVSSFRCTHVFPFVLTALINSGGRVKIAKVLNNNIAIAVDDAGRDVIAMGCGVAFQRRHGDEVDEAKIERLFTQGVPELSRRFGELAAQVPEEYFEAAQSIIANAKMQLGCALDDSLYLMLTDHIHFSIDRVRRGITIQNALLLETKMIYREEYEVAREAVAYLNERFDVVLPEDEAAFIALHLVNAGGGGTMDDTFKIARMVQEVNTLARKYYGVEIDPESLDYYRLLVHLKFFATRVVAAESRDDELQDRQLFDLIKHQYASAYECATCVAALVEGGYHYRVSNNELMYLTIHLQRVYGMRRRA